MGKNILIVGGSSGIGLEIAKKLKAKGEHVITASRHEGELSAYGINHQQYDVLTDDKIELNVDQLSGMVYCPGSINLRPFNRLKREDFLQDFEINVLGAIKVVQEVLPLFKKSDTASLVFFSTVAVNQGMAYHASVAASKGAIEGLTRSLAAELAPKIRVNCIAPSIVKTPLAQRLLATPEKEEASAKRHPLQSVGEPEDLGALAAFLLSQEARWVTGQILGVDGGMSSIKMM